jgi:hypothetical protein
MIQVISWRFFMNIRQGYVITVRHYSLLNVFKGIVTDVQDNAVTIKLPKECLKTSFLKGDPLVIAYEANGTIAITGGLTIDFSSNKEQLTFIKDEQDEGMKMRSYERYPVSLYADFRLAEIGGGKKCFALVKDISDYGILIYARESYFKGQKLYFDIFLTRDILSLTAEIVRKVEWDNYFEYGLLIKHNGPTVFNHIKNLVKKAQEEHILKFGKE